MAFARIVGRCAIIAEVGAGCSVFDGEVKSSAGGAGSERGCVDLAVGDLRNALLLIDGEAEDALAAPAGLRAGCLAVADHPGTHGATG